MRGGAESPSISAAVALAAVAALLASCSGVITGAAVKASDGPSPGTVDIALLDVGNYPTKPSAPLGTAGTPEIGAIVEGQRMANYVTGPWEVDPGLTGSYADSALVLKNANALNFVLPEALAAIAPRHNFVTGFSTARDGSGKVLRNAVLRFPDPPAAAAAATELGKAAATEAVSNPPVQPAPIPGHPEAAGFSHTTAQATVVRAFTARGPYVFVQTAEASDVSVAAGLIAGTLDQQGPLIDQFTPTDPGQAGRPADRPDRAAGPHAAGVGQRRQRQPACGVRTARVTAIPDRPHPLGGTVRRCRHDPPGQRGDRRLRSPRRARAPKTSSTGSTTKSARAGKPVDPVNQLPNSRCLDLSAGRTANFYCLATADRFASRPRPPSCATPGRKPPRSTPC